MLFFPVVLYCLAWILAVTMYTTEQGYLAMEIVRYMLLFAVGVQGVYGFFVNYVFGSSKAGRFQHMTAMANLSYGVLGILSFWFPELWIATALGVSVFYLGSAYMQMQDAMVQKSVYFSFFGPVFYLDIIVPLTLWLAMLFFYA